MVQYASMKWLRDGDNSKIKMAFSTIHQYKSPYLINEKTSFKSLLFIITLEGPD